MALCFRRGVNVTPEGVCFSFWPGFCDLGFPILVANFGFDHLWVQLLACYLFWCLIAVEGGLLYCVFRFALFGLLYTGLCIRIVLGLYALLWVTSVGCVMLFGGCLQ